MFTLLLSAVLSIRAWFRSRAALQVEILALRHQLTVLKRSQRGRPRLLSADRLLWVGLSHLWSQWRSALQIVKPETVIAWHRREFRWYWRWKSRQGEPGRPAIDGEVREWIGKMSLANPLWGAPRIHGELLKLGIEVSQATVAKYMVRRRQPPSQTWRTFLNIHAKQLVSTVLRRADRDLSSSLCLRGVGAREAAPPPFQRHLPSQPGVGGTTDGRGASLG